MEKRKTVYAAEDCLCGFFIQEKNVSGHDCMLAAS